MNNTADTPISEWGLPSVSDELVLNVAHVWRASLDQPADMIAKFAPLPDGFFSQDRILRLLSQDEYQRAERFHRPSDCRRFIAGRGILRKIISAYLPHAPDEIRFVYNKYGKPFISDDQSGGALSFNLSHSNGMVLYAVASGRRVCIDVEYMREDFATLEVAERFFSQDEFEALKSVSGDHRTKAFFNCWSRRSHTSKRSGWEFRIPWTGSPYLWLLMSRLHC